MVHLFINRVHLFNIDPKPLMVKNDSVMMFNSKRDVTALLHDKDKCHAYAQKSSQKKQQEHGSEQKGKYKHPEQKRWQTLDWSTRKNRPLIFTFI